MLTVPPCIFSFQLLSYHQRAFLRTLLSHPSQPTRPNCRHDRFPLLQISILPFSGTDRLHPQPRQLSRPRFLRHHFYKPVRRDYAIPNGRRAASARHLLQVRHRAHPVDDQRRKRKPAGVGGEGGECGERGAGRRWVVLSINGVGG